MEAFAAAIVAVVAVAAVVVLVVVVADTKKSFLWPALLSKHVKKMNSQDDVRKCREIFDQYRNM